jgi:hypothetical protein
VHRSGRVIKDDPRFFQFDIDLFKMNWYLERKKTTFSAQFFVTSSGGDGDDTSSTERESWPESLLFII